MILKQSSFVLSIAFIFEKFAKSDMRKKLRYRVLKSVDKNIITHHYIMFTRIKLWDFSNSVSNVIAMLQHGWRTHLRESADSFGRTWVHVRFRNVSQRVDSRILAIMSLFIIMPFAPPFVNPWDKPFHKRKMPSGHFHWVLFPPLVPLSSIASIEETEHAIPHFFRVTFY